MYTFSLAVLVQALTLISFSALADYGWYTRLPTWKDIGLLTDQKTTAKRFW